MSKTSHKETGQTKAPRLGRVSAEDKEKLPHTIKDSWQSFDPDFFIVKRSDLLAPSDPSAYTTLLTLSDSAAYATSSIVKRIAGSIQQHVENSSEAKNLVQKQREFIDEVILSGASIQSEAFPGIKSPHEESQIAEEQFDLLDQLLDATLENLEKKTKEIDNIRSEISDLLHNGSEDSNVVGIK
tara:strand:+ start:20330 stop:20881 length:552 start_codon:yes stop_codon:yes gene_type:complete